jgi:peptidoglycan/LPS O-acetylase OafA/YrhL
MFDRAGRFPLMDSLRAIAALAIVAYHVAPHAGAFRGEFTSALSAQFSTGVALFFLISGCLLYRPFVLAHTSGERLPDVRAYAWRRFLRIVPAYWAALTVTGLFIAPEVFDRPLLFYGFAQIYSPGAVFDGIPVAWTLCIEVSFYAFLPGFALALRGVAKRSRSSVWRVEAIAIAALFVFGLAWRGLALAADGEALQTSVNTLPAWLAWFAIGMGLAVASAWLAEGGAKSAFVRFVERAPGACWAVAAAALAVNAWVFGRRYLGGDQSDLELLAIHVTEAICALGMILPAVFAGDGRGRVRQLLAWPVLLWLGLVSYGIYLWQAATLRGLADLTPLDGDIFDSSLWWIPFGFGGCIAAGALSWYVLERRAMSLRRLVPPRPSGAVSRSAEAAAARVAP